MVGILFERCRCAVSWYNLDLTFDLAIVTLSYKILFRVYLVNLRLRKLTHGRDIGKGL